MSGESIAIGMLIGIFTGVITGFFILAFKRYSQVKNAIARIRQQNLTHILNGKPHDFIGSIDKDLKKFGGGEETKSGFFNSILKRDKKHYPSAPIEDYGVKLSEKKERRPSKKNSKKENKKHPYKKVRKKVKKK